MRDNARREGKHGTMRAISKGQMLLGAAFLGLTGVAGAILLADERTATTSAAEAKRAIVKAVAKPAPKKPVDERFVIKRVLPISGPIKYGEWHWDEEGAPKGGPIVITVDLEARVLSIFRSGYEIGATAVLLGTEEKPTPLGVFPITQKKRHHVSNLYDAEMPYMQRLTDDGVALHASEVEWGYASHGCIGMPESFAAKVFATTRVGDRVFITRGKMVKTGDSLVES
jgi:lipoprotein-anchoring transpeptidase ErfK/SrfK